MTPEPRCPDCGGWRLLTWQSYLDSPDDAAICPGTPLGRWFWDLGTRWEEAGVSW